MVRVGVFSLWFALGSVTLMAAGQFGVLGSMLPQAQTVGTLPCDVISGCVAAHSVTRRILASYTGNLFQMSKTGGSTQNIGQNGTLVDLQGIATFCSTSLPLTQSALTSCGAAFHIIYDQTGHSDDVTAVHGDIPMTLDSTNYPTVTTGAAITSGGLNVFLNKASPSNTPSGGVDASMYAVANDGAIPLNQSCGFYGLFHAVAAPDTPGTDLGLIFRQDVAGHRGMGFDLEEEVIEAWVGTYSADSSTGFSTLANPNIERRGRFIGIGSYTSSSKTLYVDMNGGEQTFSWVGPWTSSSGSTTSNTGGEIRIGAGGDGCATETVWQEGAIWSIVLNATQRQNLVTNVKNFYSIPSATSCTTVASSALGVSNVTAAWGLRVVANAWAGAVAVVHDDAHSSVNAVMSSGCDIDTTALAALCTTTCEAQRLDNQIQTGHLEDYRNGSGDPWHADQPTLASAPSVLTSCTALTTGRPCLSFNGSTQLSGGASGLSMTRPYSVWAVGKRTSGTNGGMVVFSGSQPFLGGGGSANQAAFQSSSGSPVTVTAADGTYFARMGTATSAGSNNLTIALNGSRTTTTATTTNSSALSVFLGNSFTGTLTEAGVAAIAVSAGNEATIATNQCSYWGFTSC